MPSGGWMRGYVTFVLAFLGAAILLSSYSLLGPASSSDLSKAISVERAYGLQMNIKETAIGSIRQGALEGFGQYDRGHDIKYCISCPGACIPPPSPNPCDPARCTQCFREAEARASAAEGASHRLASLDRHPFDDAFSVTIGEPAMDVFLRPEPLSKNGFSVDYAVMRSPLEISVESGALGISAASELPEGMVIG